MRFGAFVVFLALIASAQDVTQGTFRGKDRQGRAIFDCPLERTRVTGEVSGLVARVNVTQTFVNSSHETIEGVYTFPLPHNAAVDRLTMTVGSRKIVGVVKRREEARAMYDAAHREGRVASLLDHERPNIFTQSVANIVPGEHIQVEISYVETVKYEDGAFEFVFPMVVAPRYNPASQNVADARRISPPVAPAGTRPGHEVSITVDLDAGLPVADLSSPTHDIVTWKRSAAAAHVELRDLDEIPNKDFILRYTTAGDTIRDAVLAQQSAKGGFFSLVLEPPARTGARDVTPKELIFVLDTSGSMEGFPIEKAKESMLMALDGLYPDDTFNLITFAGDTDVLFVEPVPATPANLAIAKAFLASRNGAGGTEMMKAIRAALEPKAEAGRVRIVCFMTDGEVGNDHQILAEVKKHPDTRVFAFGIGQSVNRFLLDGMAALGRGAVEYVTLKDDGSAAARRFHQRIREPLLTDISIDWNGLAVSDVHPARIPDLFSAQPIVITGRYSGSMRGTARLRARAGAVDLDRSIDVNLTTPDAKHDAIAALWARQRIADLTAKDYAGVHQGTASNDLREQITTVALEHHLMSPFTSLVAVEERIVTSGGVKRKVRVPVNLAEGMNPETALPPPSAGGGVVGGVPGGVPGGSGGVIGGIIGTVRTAAPAPPPAPRQFDAGGLVAPKRVLATIAEEALPPLPQLDPSLELIARAEPDRVVEVQILLRDASATTMDAIRKLVVEVKNEPAKDLLLVVRVKATDLRALARVPAIRYMVLH